MRVGCDNSMLFTSTGRPQWKQNALLVKLLNDGEGGLVSIESDR